MNSTRYRINAALFRVVALVAAASDAKSKCNPALPADLQGDGALLFTLDRGDVQLAPSKKRDGREDRRATVWLGAVAASYETADALHFAARCAIKRASALFSDGIDGAVLEEPESQPDIKEVAFEGALLLSAFAVKYIEFYPA